MSISQLPTELLVKIFLFLDVDELISMERVSPVYRAIIVNNDIYKLKLDRIFRAKGVNNYMALRPHLCYWTKEETHKYYKMRLYKYRHNHTRQVQQPLTETNKCK